MRALFSARYLKARRFFRLGRRHSLLLLRCWWLVARVRLDLTIASYRTVLEKIDRLASDRSFLNRCDPILVAWAVRHASKLVPRATCLTQALSVRWLLARAGYDSTIRIGVARTKSERVEAHAWVLFNDEIIIGSEKGEHLRFQQIVDL